RRRRPPSRDVIHTAAVVDDRGGVGTGPIFDPPEATWIQSSHEVDAIAASPRESGGRIDVLPSRRVSRRQLLLVAGSLGSAALLAACGQAAPASPTSALSTAPTSPPAAAPSQPTATPAAAATTAPQPAAAASPTPAPTVNPTPQQAPQATKQIPRNQTLIMS